MKQFHRIVVSVFAKPEDDAEVLKQGLLNLVPINLEEEKIQLNDEKAQGFNARTIHIYTIELSKDRHMNEFLESFLGKLNEQQKKQIVTEADSRLDAELVFFIRIDKELWASDKVVQLTDSGNCYHIKIHMAAFPAKREIALDMATKVFKQ